jgi:hypothetical protein
LGSQPIPAGKPKESAQPQVSVRSNRALPGNNLADALRRDINFLRQSVLTQAHGLEKFLLKKLARGNRIQFTHNPPTSVIVDNFDAFRTRLSPPKADSPLIVDPNTELARARALQGFQTVHRRYPKVIKSRCDFQLP